MSNIENCADCGKRFGFTERIFSKTNGLWICEDCNIKQIQENDNKDQKITELEAQLAEKEKMLERIMSGEYIPANIAEKSLELSNQDKISFAVEQLELLKQKMANFDFPNNPKLYNNDMFCGGFDSHYIKTKEEIDNLIKEIKGE